MSVLFTAVFGIMAYLLIFAFFWGLCAGADGKRRFDEDAEQDEWLREYLNKHQKKA